MDQVAYVGGMITLGLVPFVDIAVAVRDTIGAAIQGEYGWAFFEVVAGALGFVVPVYGDIRGVVKDIVKWLGRGSDTFRKTDDIIAWTAKAAAAKPDDPVLLDMFVVVLKTVKPDTYATLSGKGIADADLARLARSGRSLDHLADLVKDPAVIIAQAPAPGWFDEGVTRGYWGQAAEQAIRAITGGTAKRFSLGTATIPSFRILDGDLVTDYTWNFFRAPDPTWWVPTPPC